MEFKAIVLYLIVLTWLFSNRAVGVDTQQATIATPVAILESGHVRCACVPISGLSRLNLGSYSSAHRIAVTPSDEIKKRLHKKIQICSHTNPSLGLCQCNGSGDWENIYNGMWSSLVSPNQDRFIDIMFVDKLSGSMRVSVKLELHKWRLLSGLVGIALWFLAPILSSWVKFYYGSSMALGICLLVIFLLYQGKKLLPPLTGKKLLYSTICAVAVRAGMFARNLVSSIFVDLGIDEQIWIPVGGAGTFLWNHLLVYARSAIAELGISEDSVLLLLGVGIAIAGAGFGLWLLHKYVAVVAEDGSVCAGVGQFVKWALRVFALTFIYLSTRWTYGDIATCMSYGNPPMTWQSFINSDCYSGLVNALRQSAEFIKRKAAAAAKSRLWSKGRLEAKSYFFSTFHRIPRRRNLSSQEWRILTQESTRRAVAELASTPEFADWIIRHADRIQINNSEEEAGLNRAV